MEKRTYADRFRVECDPHILESYANEDSPWQEDEAAIRAGLAWGEEKARLLKWVRRQMRQRLTPKQRACIELYYFKNMTLAEVGEKTGSSASAACRTMKRGINRLRVAVRVDPPGHWGPGRRLRRRRYR